MIISPTVKPAAPPTLCCPFTLFCCLGPLLIVFVLLKPLSGRREGLMSLPWPSNLQIDPQTHLQCAKPTKVPRRKKSFMNTAINQSEYEAVTVLKFRCNSRNRPRHPFLEIPTRPFPILHPAAIDHPKESMHVVRGASFLEPTSLP